MVSITPDAFKSLLARAGWTAAQVIVAGLIVWATGTDAAWAAPIAVGLSALKSFIAAQVGDPDTATFK